MDNEGDFPWFHQAGKVYSDTSKAVYSKYVNLHLGRAHDVMSAKDYHEVSGNDITENGMYVKDSAKDVKRDALALMIEYGCKALDDAFAVILEKKLFNIFNSTTNEIEEFDPENVKSYSQAQCAIVIERVFSGLYKYL